MSKATSKKRAKKKAPPKPKPKTAAQAVEEAEPDVAFHKLKAWPDPAQFLHALRVLGHVTAACKAAGVGRTTVYERRQRDEDFLLAWLDIEEETTQNMEREAYRRAVIGTQKPVFFKGDVVGGVTEYSDTLLIFMLKARRPETYRERIDHRHSGDQAPKKAPVDMSKLSLAQQKQLRDLLRAAKPDKAEASS